MVLPCGGNAAAKQRKGLLMVSRMNDNNCIADKTV